MRNEVRSPIQEEFIREYRNQEAAKTKAGKEAGEKEMEKIGVSDAETSEETTDRCSRGVQTVSI